MYAAGLSLSGQSFSFSYFLQYLQSFSFFSSANEIVVKKIEIVITIKIEIIISKYFLRFRPG